MLKQIFSFLLGFSLLITFQIQAKTWVPVSTGKITIFIPYNKPPKSYPDIYTVYEDTTELFDVKKNDMDDDELGLSTINITTQPSNGIAEIESGQVKYTPATNFFGADSFFYTITDQGGKTSTPAQVTITVNPINDAPVNTKSEIVWYGGINEDSYLIFYGLHGFSDVEGDSIWVEEAIASNGSTSISPAGDVTYNPTQHYHGPSHVDVYVTDGTDTSSIRWVIEVNSKPDATELSAFIVTNGADNTQTGITVTDPDGVPQEFRVEANGNNFHKSFTWRDSECPNPRPPHQCYYAWSLGTGLIDGNYTLSFSGLDDAGIPFSAPDMNFILNAGNLPPEAEDDEYDVYGNGSQSLFEVMLNDRDANADPLTLKRIVQAPSFGAANVSGNKVVFTADTTDAELLDELVYEIEDPEGSTDTARVKVKILPFTPIEPIDTLQMQVGSQQGLSRALVKSATEITFSWQKPVTENPALEVEYRFGVHGMHSTCSDGVMVNNSCLHTTASTQFVYTADTTGTTTYSVQACIKSTSFCTVSSNTVTVTATDLAVEGLTASATSIRPGAPVTLSWRHVQLNDIQYFIDVDRPEPVGESQVEDWDRLEENRRFTDNVRTSQPGHLGEYVYRITACSDSLGCGEPAYISISVENLPVPLVTDVTVNASVLTPGDYTISWQPVNEANPFYRVRVDTPFTSATDEWQELTLDSPEATSMEYTPVGDGTYRFIVAACISPSNCGAWSSPASANVTSISLNDIPDQEVTTLTRPDATDLVGQIPSDLQIAGGNVSYTVPVQVPPGRNGMEPTLALSYNSAAGNGIAGVGWSIYGGSGISRCAANLAEDGFVREASFTDEDKLCLDGQKLILVNGSSSMEYGDQGSEYRTRENTFAKITLLGGSFNSSSSYFEVRHKSGAISYYGNTPGAVSENDPKSVFVPPAKSAPLKWAIYKTVDNSVTQNSVIYKYTNSGGEQLLKTIHYTGIDDATGNRIVTFDYETRPDNTIRYINSGIIKTTQRLKEILTQVDQTSAFKYVLEYEPDGSPISGFSRLSSVQQCGFEGTSEICLPRKKMTYSGDSLDFEKISSTNEVFNSGLPWNIANQKIGDFNNDGVLDYVRYDQLHLMSIDADNQYVIDSVLDVPFAHWEGSPDPREVVKLDTLDFNNDGLLDLLGISEQGYISVALLNIATDGTVSFSTPMDLGIQNTCTIERQQILTFNGYRNTGMAFSGCHATAVPDGAGGHYLFNRIGQESGGRMYTAKIHPDCEYLGWQGLCGQIQEVSGFHEDTGVLEQFEKLPAAPQIFDYDGDGDPDIVRIEEQSTAQVADVKVVWFRNDVSGSGLTATSTFVKQTQLLSGVKKDYAMSSGGHHWIDANGDGLKDLLVSTGNWYLAINKGGYLASKTNLNISAFQVTGACGWNCSWQGPGTTSHSSIRVVDYNYDGLEDFMILNINVNTRDCLADRKRFMCQEGSGSEAASPSDFSVSPLMYGKYEVYQSSLDASGGVSFTAIPTDISGSVNNFYPVDINSDGALDFIGAVAQNDLTTTGDGPGITYLHYGKADAVQNVPDLLVSVFDETEHNNAPVKSYQQQDNFSYNSYAQHTDSPAVSNADLTDKDYYRVASAQIVVTQHDSINGIGGTNTQQFEYGAPVHSRSGLGFLGFESITEINDAQGTTSQMFYELEYPLNGKLSSQTVTESSDGSVLQQLDNTWCDLTTNSCNSNYTGVYFTSLSSRVTASYDPDENHLKTITLTNNSIDDYGNVTSQTTETSDPLSTHTAEVTNHYYSANETTWWVDKLQYSEVTNSVTYEQNDEVVALASGINNDKTSRRTLVWKANLARQISTETLTASDTGVEKVTTYNTYDDYGNLTQVTYSGVADSVVENTDAPLNIVTTYGYDTSGGYFLNTENNHVWNEDAKTITWDARFGLVNTESDVNGITLTNNYDALGRLVQISSTVEPTTDIIYQWCTNNCVSNAVYETTTVKDGAPIIVQEFDKNNALLKRTTSSFENNAAGQQNTIELFTFDGLGRLLTQTEPHFEGETASTEIYSNFDVLGRFRAKSLDSLPLDYDIAYTYTGLSSSFTITIASAVAVGDPISLTMQRKYNGLNQLMSTMDADQNWTYYRYDGNGNPIQIQDVSDNTITAKYDGFGNRQWFDDPNMGKWYFRYNGLGQLRYQQDAKNTAMTFNYDAIGRQTERHIAGSLDSKWTYDTVKKGTLAKAERNEYSKEYTFDDKIRITKEETTIGVGASAKEFEINYAYDSYYGRIKAMQYPSGKMLTFHYDQFGFNLQDVNPLANNEPYRTVLSMSQHGKIATQQSGNGLYTVNQFTVSGDLERVCVNTANHCDGNATLLDIQYSVFDAFGNLRTQNDNIYSISETYKYDKLHRIKRAVRSANGAIEPEFTPASISYDYDAAGNLTQKSDYASVYTYTGGSSGGPNAVKSVTKLNNTTVSFAYDDNGNLETGDGFSIEYNDFNKPIEIVRGTHEKQFSYGPDTLRYKQVSSSTGSSDTTTTYYVGDVYEYVEKTVNGSPTTEMRHYLGDYAVLSISEGTQTLSYLHRDRLGSTSLVTDGNKHIDDVSTSSELIVERRGFDIFGKPRDEYWGDGLNGEYASMVSPRGFTGHEHLDGMQIIHMNGRAYDPNLGRFLSVDPFIQLPENSQSINSYSYGMNNPLAGTDPSGYLFWFIPAAIAAYNIYDGATTVVETTEVLLDPNATGAEKIEATLNGAANFIDPTPGNLGKRVGDRIRGAFRGSDSPSTNVNVQTSNSSTNVTGDTKGNGANANEKVETGQVTVETKDKSPGGSEVNSSKSEEVVTKEGDFFRGAKPGESPSFTPRPNDFKVDKNTGLVKDTHGVSIFDNAQDVSKNGFVPHKVDQSTIPDSLQIIQRGQNKSHFEITPKPGANLTPEEFIKACSKIGCK